MLIAKKEIEKPSKPFQALPPSLMVFEIEAATAS
jgi:hypothetical protein